MLHGLQCGRAVAALLVVVFHANVYLLPDKLYGGQNAGDLFNFGYAGVEFFFVLSGFIMVLVHRQDFGVPSRAGRFLQKRIIRIYPFYWLVFSLLLLLYLARPGSGPDHALDPSAIVTSALLFPTYLPPVMNVAWSLQHEMLFYIIFVAMILNLKLGVLVFAAWQILCVTAMAFPGLAYPLDFFLSPYNVLFLFGILAALVYMRGPGHGAGPALLLGAMIFLGVGVAETIGQVKFAEGPRTLMFGAGAALAVYGLAHGAGPTPRWLVFLGDASYAIYLVHPPILAICGIVILKIGLHTIVPPLAMLAIVTGTAAVVGGLAHVYLERPVLAFFSRATMARPRPAE